MNIFFFLMIRRPPRSPPTNTLVPDTTLVRSDSDNAIELPLAPPAEVAAAFAAAFRQRFGYAPHAGLVVDRTRVELTAAGDAPATLPAPTAPRETEAETVPARLPGAEHPVPLPHRANTARGRPIPPPATHNHPLSHPALAPACPPPAN